MQQIPSRPIAEPVRMQALRQLARSAASWASRCSSAAGPPEQSGAGFNLPRSGWSLLQLRFPIPWLCLALIESTGSLSFLAQGASLSTCNPKRGALIAHGQGDQQRQGRWPAVPGRAAIAYSPGLALTTTIGQNPVGGPPSRKRCNNLSSSLRQRGKKGHGFRAVDKALVMADPGLSAGKGAAQQLDGEALAQMATWASPP